MAKIALLCPSRERLNRKLTVLSSLLTTVKNPDNITLFFGIDEDDPTLDTIERIARGVNFVKIIYVPKISTPPNIHKIWNYCAQQVMLDGQYDILALTADDFIFRTKDWDEMIIDEFSGAKLPPDKLKLVTCNDTHKNGELPINYFIHRRYVEMVGYIARPDFIINWCDNWIKTSFEAFGRYYYRPDIIIEHNHWVYSGQPDEVGKRMMEREGGSKANSDDLWPKLEPQRYEEVLKIARATGLKPTFKLGFSPQYHE